MVETELIHYADVWIALPCAYCEAQPGDLCKTWRGKRRGTHYSLGQYHSARHNARVLQLQSLIKEKV